MLEVNNLKTHFKTHDGVVKAVDGVSFSLEPGETMGIVGESGSGKSVTALSIMQLNPKPPAEYPEGEIIFEDQNLLETSDKRMQEIRGNDIAMIFQDCKDGGIANPERRVKEYPHQFSGGMRQRAMIAMGLSCNPKVLIADEPTTALDVTIQAQILELMVDLQEKYGTAIIMITHDLGVVSQLADNVMVMYAGRAVEQATTDEVFYDPLMPYSWSLLRSLPRLDTAGEVRLLPIEGTPPSLIFLPNGCNFSPRCPFVKDECHEIDPDLEEKKPSHKAACILSVEEIEKNKRRVDEELGVET